MEGGGGEVEGRWKDGLFQDLHVMFATGAIRNLSMQTRPIHDSKMSNFAIGLILL